MKIIFTVPVAVLQDQSLIPHVPSVVPCLVKYFRNTGRDVVVDKEHHAE